MKKPIGIFGLGIVGNVVYNGFIKDYHMIYRYDINNKYDKIEIVVNNSDIIFVCVPTPSNNNLTKHRVQQDLSYLDIAIESINKIADNEKTIIIKSTVLPGTTRLYSLQYPFHKFVFNPEFLTARTANEDFINQDQIILGGIELDDAYHLYRNSFKETLIKKVTWEEAELLKYTCNVFYATKVYYANLIYNACNKLNISYETIRQMFIDNGWVNPMHLNVPGPDGKLGFGGACLPKDLQAFISWCDDRGLDSSALKDINELNEKIRKE